TRHPDVSTQLSFRRLVPGVARVCGRPLKQPLRLAHRFPQGAGELPELGVVRDEPASFDLPDVGGGLLGAPIQFPSTPALGLPQVGQYESLWLHGDPPYVCADPRPWCSPASRLDMYGTPKPVSPRRLWWRFSDYQLRGGRIFPTRGATLEAYDPWAQAHAEG